MFGRKRARNESQARTDGPVIERQDDGMWKAIDIHGKIVRRASLSVLVEELVATEQAAHPAIFATASAEGVRVESHVTTDTQVMHCIFCGSGQVFARSDQTVECGICHRTFVAMEQPLYTAIPSPQYMDQQIGGAPPAPPAAPSFTPPPDAVALDPTQPAPGAPPAAAEEEGAPPSEDDGEDPFPPKTSGLRTETGAVLDLHHFALHLAAKYR